MPHTAYLSVFIVGLLGGVHCVGMCGGIVGALSASIGRQQRAPWGRHLAYNLGRISSYTLIGGLVGAIGSATLLFNRFLPVQLALYLLANALLICLGVYLTGQTRVLAGLERFGHRLWVRVEPLGRRFIGRQRWYQALPLGFVWGFLPCGLTYSVLSTALVSGSAVRGAGLMLAFGLGTLPNLLLAGMLLVRYRGIVRSRVFRVVAGSVVIVFGVYGLYRAPELGGRLWAGVICEV